MISGLAEAARKEKEKILAQKEKICEVDIEISKLREELVKLQGQIVQSPERIKSESERRVQELEAWREEKRKLEKEYLESVHHVEKIQGIIKSLKPDMETFTEAFNEIETLRNKCGEVETVREAVKAKSKKMIECQKTLEGNQNAARHLREQISKETRGHERLIANKTTLNEGIKMELDKMRAAQGSNNASLMEEEAKLMKKLDDLELNHEKFKEKAEEVEKQKVEAWNNLSNRILSGLKEVNDLAKNKNK